MRYIGAAFSLLLLVTPAWAGLSRADLATVSAAPPRGARLGPNLVVHDVMGKRWTMGQLLGGHPVFFNFVDYTCNTLCGTDLELLSAGIANAHLNPAEYRIVVFGIDPKDSARDALTMARKEIPPALLPRTVLLLPDKRTVDLAAKSLGFHYAYDAEVDQFAHPAAVYVIGSDGGVRGVLSPFALVATDMRAELEATNPSLTIFDRIRLLCYCYDPETGIYSLRIAWMLRIACGFTVLLLGGTIFFLIKRARTA
jgi:protein SCO1/2